MANGQRLLLLRSAALVTLAVSAALLAAYLRPHSIVCGFDFDCEEMLSSPHGKLLGAPLPLWGILTFAAIFACTLSARSRWLWLLRFLALAAGIGGMSLIFVQVFVLRRVCPLCMIVDSCALIVAYAVFAGRGEVGAMPLGRRRRCSAAPRWARPAAGWPRTIAFRRRHRSPLTGLLARSTSWR
jgi:uncharacterized membrane protein